MGVVFRNAGGPYQPATPNWLWPSKTTVPQAESLVPLFEKRLVSLHAFAFASAFGRTADGFAKHGMRVVARRLMSIVGGCLEDAARRKPPPSRPARRAARNRHASVCPWSGSWTRMSGADTPTASKLMRHQSVDETTATFFNVLKNILPSGRYVCLSMRYKRRRVRPCFVRCVDV